MSPSGSSRTLLPCAHRVRGAWISVMPSSTGPRCSGTPLPNGLSLRRHLGEIVRVHAAGVVLRAGRILARGKAVFLHPSFDTPGDIVGNPAHAIQQHVSVAQQDAVVMVVGMSDFPQHLAVPVCLQDHATLERKPAEKA